jgi:hypothetical protein
MRTQIERKREKEVSFIKRHERKCNDMSILLSGLFVGIIKACKVKIATNGDPM